METVTLDQKAAIGELKALVGSRGWAIFEQIVQKDGLSALDSLSALKRPEGVTDDFLRGRIAAFKDVIRGPRKIISDFEANVAAQKAEREMDPVGSPYVSTGPDEAGTNSPGNQ